MDVSSEYINMCRKAKEIQDLWKPEIGDWCISVWASGSQHLQCVDFVLKTDFGYELRSGQNPVYVYINYNSIWLPRQDQLQDMLCNHSDINEMTAFERMHSWIEKRYDHHQMSDWTLEQAWLRCIMFGVYNKVWKDEDWVKQ